MIDSIQLILNNIEYEESLEFDYEVLNILPLKPDILFIALNKLIVSQASIRFSSQDRYKDLEPVIRKLFTFLPGFIFLIFL